MIETVERLAALIPAASALVAPATAVAGWYWGHRKRRIEGIENLQKTVDMLVAKNCELTKDLLELRETNMRLTQTCQDLSVRVGQLTRKNTELTTQLESWLNRN